MGLVAAWQKGGVDLTSRPNNSLAPLTLPDSVCALDSSAWWTLRDKALDLACWWFGWSDADDVWWAYWIHVYLIMQEKIIGSKVGTWGSNPGP